LAIDEYDDRIGNGKNLQLWARKYHKLYDKLILFHNDFDKDFDLPSHEGYEGRVFVNDEIEVEAEDFKEILKFLDLYQDIVVVPIEQHEGLPVV